jgi:hypothetical protein
MKLFCTLFKNSFGIFSLTSFPTGPDNIWRAAAGNKHVQ